jgi:hypothetical protein
LIIIIILQEEYKLRSLGLFFDPEDGDNIFLQNAGWFSMDYTALYPKRQTSPLPPLGEYQILHRMGVSTERTQHEFPVQMTRAWSK